MAGMERLTRRIGSSVVFPNELLGISLAPDNECMHKLLTKLAAYEDTKMMPEDIDALRKREQGLAEMLVDISCDCAVTYTRLAELAQAEKDGRLAVLPCKEGDPVWWINVAWLPGNGPMFYKIDSGKFRFAMLDWQNPIYTSQADAEAALAEMAKKDA